MPPFYTVQQRRHPRGRHGRCRRARPPAAHGAVSRHRGPLLRLASPVAGGPAPPCAARWRPSAPYHASRSLPPGAAGRHCGLLCRSCPHSTVCLRPRPSMPLAHGLGPPCIARPWSYVPPPTALVPPCCRMWLPVTPRTAVATFKVAGEEEGSLRKKTVA